MDVIGNYIDDDASIEIKLCEVCNKIPKIYKCPKCSVLTCSLTCCKAHKVNTNCSGKRDRSEYIGMSDYSESDLKNDFHFLEDVLQDKDKSKRSFSLTGGKSINPAKDADSSVRELIVPNSTQPQGSSQPYDKNLKRLIKEAQLRGTRLITLPPMMSRRKSNNTKVTLRPAVAGGSALTWRVRLVYIMNDDFTEQSLLSHELDHSSSISTESGCVEMNIIRNTFVTTVTTSNENLQIKNIIGAAFQSTPETVFIRQALRPLRAAFSSQGLRVFLQSIPSPANSPLFCELPLEFTLRSALADKTVIEYPVLFIGSLKDTAKLRFMISTIDATVSTPIQYEESVSISKRKLEAEERGVMECPASKRLNTEVPLHNDPEREDVDIHDEAEEDCSGNEETRPTDPNVLLQLEDRIEDAEDDEEDEKEFFEALRLYEHVPVEKLLQIVKDSM